MINQTRMADATRGGKKRVIKRNVKIQFNYHNRCRGQMKNFIIPRTMYREQVA